MIIDENIISNIKNFLEKKDNGTFILFGDSKQIKLMLIDKMKELLQFEKIMLIDNDTIPIEKVRYMLNFVKLKSNVLRFVVVDLDNVNIYSMNAMLKTLEEPPSNCFFFLLKSDTNIIPTILSRSIRIFVNPDKSKLIEYLIKNYHFPLNWAEFLFFLTNGNWDLILFFIENMWNQKERKPKENFSKLISFVVDGNENLLFDEDYWLKNFGSFISFKFLLKFIKSFVKDIFIINKILLLKDVEIIKMLEKNLVFSKIISKDKLISSYYSKYYSFDVQKILDNTFDQVSKINNANLFKKINKKILYFTFIYQVYQLISLSKSR